MIKTGKKRGIKLLLIKRNNLLSIVMALSVLVCTAKAEIKVYAFVDNSKDIYENSRFDYKIMIDGDDKAGDVDTTAFDDFDPQGPNESNVSQKSITIINGKRSVNEVKRYIMTYRILAPEAGHYDIGPVKVTIDGKDYYTNPVTFSVIKAASTDKMDIEMKLSKSKCYVGEPVILSVNWYIRYSITKAIGDYGFNVPIFKNSDIILDDLNDLSSSSQVITVNGNKVAVEQSRARHKGFSCLKFTFKKVLIPTTSGTFELEPSSVSAKIAVSSSRSRDSFFDGFFDQREYKIFSVRSNPLTLEVEPLPNDGKTSSDIKLVGKYSITATATPDKVKVGDPIELKVVVRGDYLKAVDWSDLKFPENFEKDFIVSKQKQKPKIENGKKIFTQTIRARNDSIDKIASISINYFDVASGKYSSARSNAIDIQVSPNKMLTLADVEGLDGNMVSTSKKVTSEANGIKANLESHRLLEDQSFSVKRLALSSVNLTLWAITILMLIVSLVVRFLRNEDPAKKILKRQKQAASKAIRKINSINASDSQEAKKALAEAMLGYVADRFNRREATVTSHDCYEEIEKILGSDDASKYSTIIDNSQASIYSSLKADYDARWAEVAIDVIKRIEEGLK